MTRSRFLAASLLTLLSCALLPGDEPAARPVPLPPHYRRLGLSGEQEKNIRQARAPYRRKLEELRKQIQAVEKEEAAALEKFLTDPQKARLKELNARGAGTFKVMAPLRPFRATRGRDTTFGVELKPDDAFEGEVRLTYPDLPAGFKIKPDPFVFKEGGSRLAELTLTVGKEVPVAEYRFTIRATPDNGEPAELTVKVLVGT